MQSLSEMSVRFTTEGVEIQLYAARVQEIFPVVIATGFHLFPFRTEKLSPTAPMVLHTRGRVGHRHFTTSLETRKRLGALLRTVLNLIFYINEEIRIKRFCPGVPLQLWCWAREGLYTSLLCRSWEEGRSLLRNNSFRGSADRSLCRLIVSLVCKLLLSAKLQNDTIFISAMPINRRCGLLFGKVSPLSDYHSSAVR